MNQKNRKFKGVLSGFMATALTASLLPLPEAKANFNDVYGAWYVDSVNRWAAAGVITGKDTEQNLFYPDDNIKRAEIAIMLDQVMGYEASTDKLFTDLLNSNAWYYDALSKANAAGIINGDSATTISPEVYTTRQTAATILCAAFHLDKSDKTVSSFADNSSIDPWAMSSVITLSEMGIISGRGENRFEPLANVTRAEFAGMLNKLIGTYISDNGTFTDITNPNGTIVINKAGTQITSRSIDGDLIIAEGIQEGDIYLDNVSVSGNIIIKGGGVESIYLNNVTCDGDMLVSRSYAPVRVVMQGNTVLPTVRVQDDSILDSTLLTAEGRIGSVQVESTEINTPASVTLLGNYEQLVNNVTGVEFSITDGFISEIICNASAEFNGQYVAGGSSFDSNSIPNVLISEPNITLNHDYGTAAEDEDNDPSAETAVMSTSFDSTTMEVTTVIRVEDEYDCMLMAEAQNAITVYNPNDVASLAALELDVTRKDSTSYTEFTVVFTMTQNFTEVPLSVNFKDKYTAPEVNLISNFNNLPNASATVELVDVDYKTTTSMVSGTVDLSEIKYCEPHYHLDYAITSNLEDIDLLVSKVSYDSDEATAYINFGFDATEVDSVDLYVNFLKTDAEDEIPSVKSYLNHDEDGLAGKCDIEYYELNAQGLVEVKIEVPYLGMDSQLSGSTSKSVTILADSGETEYGYGLSFDTTLVHEGAQSYFIVTFVPDSEIEEVTFLVNVEDLDENIPVISLSSNNPRISGSAYATINMNTRYYSKGKVSMEVSVDLEKLEEITGYELSSEVFTPYVNNAKLTDYTITKLEDGLYEVKFAPSYLTDTEATDPLATTLELNLEQSDDYMALYPVTSAGHYATVDGDVPATNLPYAVEAVDANSSADYDFAVTFSMISTEDLGYDSNATDAQMQAKKDYAKSLLAIRLKETTEEEEDDDVVENYVESWYVNSVSSGLLSETGENSEKLYKNTITVRFESMPRITADDIILNVQKVYGAETNGELAEPVYVAPDVSFTNLVEGTDYKLDGGLVQSNGSTSEVKYNFTALKADLAYDFACSNTKISGFTAVSNGKNENGQDQYTISFHLDSSTMSTTGVQLAVTITSDVSAKEYSATAATMTNGSVKITGGTNVEKGETVTVEFTAESDYQLVKTNAQDGSVYAPYYLEADGETKKHLTPTTDTAGEYTFTMPSYDVTIYADFEAVVVEKVPTVSSTYTYYKSNDLETSASKPQNLTVDKPVVTTTADQEGNYPISVSFKGTDASLVHEVQYSYPDEDGNAPNETATHSNGTWTFSAPADVVVSLTIILNEAAPEAGDLFTVSEGFKLTGDTISRDDSKQLVWEYANTDEDSNYVLQTALELTQNSNTKKLYIKPSEEAVPQTTTTEWGELIEADLSFWLEDTVLSTPSASDTTSPEIAETLTVSYNKNGENPLEIKIEETAVAYNSDTSKYTDIYMFTDVEGFTHDSQRKGLADVGFCDFTIQNEPTLSAQLSIPDGTTLTLPESFGYSSNSAEGKYISIRVGGKLVIGDKTYTTYPKTETKEEHWFYITTDETSGEIKVMIGTTTAPGEDEATHDTTTD